MDYVFTVRPDLILQLSGGAIRSRQTGYTAGVQVEKRLGGTVWATGSYQRYLAFVGALPAVGSAPPAATRFANGLMPGFLYQVVSGGVRGQLTQRFGVNVHGLVTRNSPSGGRTPRTLLGRARLDYRLTDRFIPFVSMDFFHQNVNSFLNFPLARKRYFGGLDIVLANPREAVIASRRPVKADENADARAEDRDRRKEEK